MGRGKIYEILTKDDKTYLKKVDADAVKVNDLTDDAWNQVLITAATKSSVILTEVADNEDGTYSLGASGLYDLADDVVITYVYGSSLSQKTSNLPTAIPFVELNDGIVYHDGYVVYTTNAYGIEVYNDGTIWRKVADDQPTQNTNFVVSDSDMVNGVTMKVVGSDANVYSYVRIDEDGVVTDIIIKVTSSSDNTQVTVGGVAFVK